MSNYKMCYRVNSNHTSDNQYETVTASTQSAAKKLIEAKYVGSKISWVHSPTTQKSPSWYKG